MRDAEAGAALLATRRVCACTVYASSMLSRALWSTASECCAATVALLDAPRLGEAERLSQLSPGDLFWSRLRALYPQRGGSGGVAEKPRDGVIAVTDSRSSPLVPPARHAFFIPHASSFFSNSMGAYIAFAKGYSISWLANWANAPSLPLRAGEVIGEMGIETG